MMTRLVWTERHQKTTVTGERAEIVRRTDNLTVGGGEFSAPRSPTAPAAGERATPVRPQDNLRMEGKFSGQ